MVKKIILILLLLLSLNSCNDANENKMLYYINILKKYEFKNVSIKKVQIDPSYNFPYNVYIKLSLNEAYHEKLIKDLGLISKEEADTVSMRRKMNVDEYQLYFSMSSINKSRNSFLETIEKNISWWPQKFSGPFYAASYLDTGKDRKPVSFTQKRNGRIIASIRGFTIFFLIECWG